LNLKSEIETMNFPPPTERQARIIWLGLTGAAVIMFIAVIVALVWGLGRVIEALSPVIWPLAVAGVVAYLLDPIVDFFERKGLSRAWAIISVFFIAVLIVVIVLVNIIPPIVGQTRSLVTRVPEISTNVEQRIDRWVNSPPDWLKFLNSSKPSQPAPLLSTNIVLPGDNTNAVAPAPLSSGGTGLQDTFDKAIKSAATWLADFLPKAGLWLVSRFSVLVGVVLIPIYAFYLLLEKSGIQSKWTNYLPIKDSALKDELVFILGSINDYMIAFFRGQVLVALIDGLMYGLGFWIVGVPYAILIGAASVVLTIVPFVGAIIVFVTAMILSLVQYGDWKHPLLVLLVFAIVQTLESVWISPRIMKGRVGLHPLTIIIAVMVGTSLLGGLLGGVLAIPLTAVLRVLMARYVWKRPQTAEAS
jgi:predicted PurR-regulated permease PerM